MRKSVALYNYYQFVKSRPCLCCGLIGKGTEIEAAHIKPPSTKLGQGTFAPRSHKGTAAMFCIPLCADCHRLGRYSLTNSREADWLERNIAPLAWVYAALALQIAEWTRTLPAPEDNPC